MYISKIAGLEEFVKILEFKINQLMKSQLEFELGSPEDQDVQNLIHRFRITYEETKEEIENQQKKESPSKNGESEEPLTFP